MLKNGNSFGGFGLDCAEFRSGLVDFQGNLSASTLTAGENKIGGRGMSAFQEHVVEHWSDYLFWAVIAGICYFALFHYQGLPLRGGYYTCKEMSVEQKKGEPLWPVIDNSLIRNPVGSAQGEGWESKSAIKRFGSVELFLEDGESVTVDENLVNIPLISESYPKEEALYVRNFGISDFIIVTNADEEDSVGPPDTVLLYKCHKPWRS